MQAQAYAQTQTRPSPRFHRQSQSPSHRTSPAGYPAETRKATNVSLPSLFNCQTAIPNPLAPANENGTVSGASPAKRQSVERLLQTSPPGCQQDVIYGKAQENPHFRPQSPSPGTKNFYAPA